MSCAQRQIGVGWASLRSRPPPASHPALTVTGVDATFSEIGAVSGKGSQARRAELVAGLFAAATETEQTFLLRLLGGELRQGALAGIMADAVAKAADIPAAAVQRAAMLGGDLPAVAAAAGCPAERWRWTRSPCGWAGRSARCWRRPRPAWPTRSNATAAQRFSRQSWTARECRSTAPETQVTVYTRSLDDVTARLPEVVEATLALPVDDLIADGEAIALRPDNRPHRFQVTASRFGRSVDVAAAQAAQPLSVFFFDILHCDGVDLLDAPTTERLAALDALVPPAAPGRSADHVGPGGGRRLPGRDAGRRPRRRDGQGAGRARTRRAAAGRAGSRSSRCTRWIWWCSPSSGGRGAAAASSPISTWARVIRPPANS